MARKKTGKPAVERQGKDGTLYEQGVKARRNNEGSVYELKNGKWAASVTIPGTGGKRKVKTAPTWEDANRLLVAMLSDIHRGTPPTTGRQTVGQFLTFWLENIARPSIKETTYHSYEEQVRLHLEPGLGKLAIDKINQQHLVAYMNRKLGGLDGRKPLAPRTVAYQRAILRRAFKHAVEWGLMPRNVAALVNPPRVVAPEMDTFTEEEAKQFKEAVKGDRLETAFLVAVSLGLRRGELLGLKWDDFDEKRGILHIRRTLIRISGQGKAGLKEGTPKTAESRRSIQLPQFLIDSLRQHRLRQKEAKMAAGRHWKETGYIFTSLVGTPVEPRNFNRYFDRILSQAGLQKIRVHDMRHTAATMLLLMGVPQKVVQEILGHATATMTNRYIHVLGSMRQQAADKLDELYG